MDYFVQNYASNAVNAFKARATEQVQESICGNFASGIIPDFGDLSLLGEPASPPQFTGRLTVIPFSTVTNPPTSHYKVFYRIYAGESGPASYRVYLTGEGDSSYFRDASGTRLVAQGTVAPGDTVIESEDFTAPTGYKKLCVNVNGQEECDFKEVSTSFALDFVKDQYIDQQATQTNINSENACVSGTVSGYSLLQTPSSAVEELSNPDISNYGIIRFCATSNPGIGTDSFVGTNKSRFREVGNCGSPNLKCWLDTNSLKGITEFAGTQENILSDLSTNVNDALSKEEARDIEKVYTEVTVHATSMSDEERLSKINQIIDKVFFNHQKAALYYAKGEIYSNLAVNLYLGVKKAADQKKSMPTSSAGFQASESPIDRSQIDTCEKCLDYDKAKYWCVDQGVTPYYACYLDSDSYPCKATITDEDRCPVEGEEVDTSDFTIQTSTEPAAPEGNIFTDITDAEKEIINSVDKASDCSKCGGTWADTNICDSIECEEISKKVKELPGVSAYCEFNALIRSCSTRIQRGDFPSTTSGDQAVA